MSLADVAAGQPHIAAHNDERHSINSLQTTVTNLQAAVAAVVPGTIADGSITDVKISATAAISADKITDGVTNHVFTSVDDTKLTGIATGATANSTDATLLSRANHTGTQSADTLTDGTTNKAFLATERTKLTGIATGATANSTDAALKDRANHTGTQAFTTLSGFQTLEQAAPGTPFVVKTTDAGSTWTYAGTTVTQRPTSRTDMPMWVAGNTSVLPSWALSGDFLMKTP